MLLPLLLLFIVGLLILAISQLYFVYDMRSYKFSGPKPIPILGNGLMFMGDSIQFLQTVKNILEEYGSMARVYILSDRFLIINDPKDVEAVVANSEHITKASSYKFLFPWLGQGLLTATGKRWFSHRKFLTSAFHFNILKTFLPIFVKNDEVLVKKLKKVADGSPINIFPLMALVALDNVSEAAMGVSLNAQCDKDSEYVAAVNEISEVTYKRMRHPILGVDALFNLSNERKRQDHALKILHGYTHKVITNRREKLEEMNTTLQNYDTDTGIKKKCAFLDLLLLSEVDGKMLTDVKIREEVDTFMFEGHDTTASGLAFALYALSHHRQVQENVFEEQKQIFHDNLHRHPTYTELSEMKYLDMVIRESLRIYPSVPIIGRRITTNTVLNGKIVPKNTDIMLNIMEMQRRPDVFEDPLEFRPERFESSNLDHKNAYNFMAFSAGPRNCIGQKFAMMEMKLVLSSVVRNFTLLPYDTEPLLCADLILRSQNGVHVKLMPRT